jgi:hypothetical protein
VELWVCFFGPFCPKSGYPLGLFFSIRQFKK